MARPARRRLRGGRSRAGRIGAGRHDLDGERPRRRWSDVHRDRSEVAVDAVRRDDDGRSLPKHERRPDVGAPQQRASCECRSGAARAGAVRSRRGSTQSSAAPYALHDHRRRRDLATSLRISRTTSTGSSSTRASPERSTQRSDRSLIKSTDGGQTWSRVPIAAPTARSRSHRRRRTSSTPRSRAGSGEAPITARLGRK